MFNVHAAIVTWNVCLNRLVSDLPKGKMTQLDEINVWVELVWCRNVVIC